MGLFDKLTAGLAKTRNSFTGGLKSLFSGKVDEEFFEELEEALILADVGVQTSLKLTEQLRQRAKAEHIRERDALWGALEEEIAAILAAPGGGGLQLTAGKLNILLMTGVNGAGKTTTLRIIAGLERPTSGRVLIDGTDVTGLPPEKRPVNTVFQNYALFPHMNVYQNIAYGLKVLGISKSEQKERVTSALSLVRLAGFERRMPSQLSGGQRQRVAIARAVVLQPKVLLLDEPLGALDLKLRKEMQLELKRLQREMNITFIYVTHDQEEALTMSDTVVVMNGGKVQQIGTPEDIYNEPKNAFVADFIGDSNIVDGVMHRDFLVSFSGVEFPCVDRGFAREESVQVVVRPEDIEVVSPVEGQLVGVVNDVIFKGVHFEMHVECEGREWLIHSTRACTPGETIGMRIGPNEIHIMSRSEG